MLHLYIEDFIRTSEQNYIEKSQRQVEYNQYVSFRYLCYLFNCMQFFVSFECIYCRSQSCVVAGGIVEEIKKCSDDTHVIETASNCLKVNANLPEVSLINLTMRKRFFSSSQTRMCIFSSKIMVLYTEISTVFLQKIRQKLK